jgi:hypothetical protein
MHQKLPTFYHRVSCTVAVNLDDRRTEQFSDDQFATPTMQKPKMKPIKIVNDLLFFGSTGLGLCFALHVYDPSAVLAAKSAIDALHAVGQRIEKRIEEKPQEGADNH